MYGDTSHLLGTMNKYLDEGLTLKVPRKTASENVVCLCRLLNIFANFSKLFFCIPANSVDPDQTAFEGAV